MASVNSGRPTPTPTPTPTTETETASRGESSRAAILRSASALFAERGYRGASIASIAEAAQLSQPGLLHHFPSKQQLLHAVLAERDHEDGKRSAEHLKKKGLEILPALGKLVEYNVTAPDAVRLFSVLLGEGVAPEHPAHPYFVERYQRIRSRILRNLRLAEQTGQVAPGHDLEAITSIVVALLDGLQYQWLLDERVDMVRCYNALCALLIQQLRTPPPTNHADNADTGRATR